MVMLGAAFDGNCLVRVTMAVGLGPGRDLRVVVTAHTGG